MYCKNYGNFPFCNQCRNTQAKCDSYKETTQEEFEKILQMKGKQIWY